VTHLTARAVIGGVESAIATRIFRGETNGLGRLLFELLDWVNAYVLADPDAPFDDVGWGGRAVRPPKPYVAEGAPAKRSPPRRPSALLRGTAEGTQRDRILNAVAQLSRDRGYLNTTVGDIVTSAQISRRTFYEQFEGKHAAYKAAQVAALQASISRAAEAFFGADEWRDRVWEGLKALLTFTAENPDLAYLDIVDSYAVGGEAIMRSIENRMAFSVFLADGYRERNHGPRLPQFCSEAIGGAILELLRAQLLGPGAERSLEVLPQVAHVALAPFIGPGETLKYIQKRVERMVLIQHSNMTTQT
jgi:AcrR family transcriptional regulator